MAENEATTFELKKKQMEYLDEMARKHNLPDRSKALRCLIEFAMEQSDQEESIFTVIRCSSC